jgi:hypothetical protein
MPTIATSSAKKEFKYFMSVPPTSLDAFHVCQVGASVVSWNAVLALMDFFNTILPQFNVGFRLGVRKLPERAVNRGLSACRLTLTKWLSVLSRLPTNFEISTTAVTDPDSATIKTSTAGLLASSMSGLHE